MYTAPELEQFYTFNGFFDTTYDNQMSTSIITELNLKDGYILTQNSKYMLGSVDPGMLPFLWDYLLNSSLRLLITPKLNSCLLNGVSPAGPPDILSWIKNTTGLELTVAPTMLHRGPATGIRVDDTAVGGTKWSRTAAAAASLAAAAVGTHDGGDVVNTHGPCKRTRSDAMSDARDAVATSNGHCVPGAVTGVGSA